jgi:hypothetical protein
MERRWLRRMDSHQHLLQGVESIAPNVAGFNRQLLTAHYHLRSFFLSEPLMFSYKGMQFKLLIKNNECRLKYVMVIPRISPRASDNAKDINDSLQEISEDRTDDEVRTMTRGRCRPFAKKTHQRRRVHPC